MDRNLEYAGLHNKDLVADETPDRMDTMFDNVQLFGEMFSNEITKNSMIFLCTKKGLKTYFIRLHVIEGRDPRTGPTGAEIFKFFFVLLRSRPRFSKFCRPLSGPKFLKFVKHLVLELDRTA